MSSVSSRATRPGGAPARLTAASAEISGPRVQAQQPEHPPARGRQRLIRPGESSPDVGLSVTGRGQDIQLALRVGQVSGDPRQRQIRPHRRAGGGDAQRQRQPPAALGDLPGSTLIRGDAGPSRRASS